MALNGTRRRRWLGVVFLVGALGTLIAGETFLKGRLEGLGFLAYWSLCFAFTGLAIVVAYLDARALQRHTRQETRQLLESTLSKIEQDARKKPPRLPADRRD